MDERPGAIPPRAIHITVAVVLTLSFVGFAAGTRIRDISAPLPQDEVPAPTEAVPAARTYTQLRDAPLTAAITWDQAKGRLGADAVNAPLRDADAQRAVRDSRRAYDGAPPTIPHPVAQRDAGSCLKCHEQGLRVGARTASSMSHDFKSQCLQCHAQGSGTGAPSDALLIDSQSDKGSYGRNLFAGVRGATRGARAWDIAPPVIPHRTFMRENCLSCHADGGSSPLLTSHPERASCEQCHAPSAALDQRLDLTP